MLTNVMSGFYRLSEWVMRMAILNLLWLLFTLIGGVIFGFGPSTAAMFAIVRKWILGHDDIPVFKTFWHLFKEEFVRANILSSILIVVGYILFLDLRFFLMQDGFIFRILSFVIILLSFIYVITAMYVFPVFVHYNLKLAQYLGNACLIAIATPFVTILMIMSLVSVYLLLVYVPGLIPFFGGSCISFCLMWLAYLSIRKVEAANETINEGGDAIDKGNCKN
ncbi:YesL family protein [Gracilibacillus sp. D59]|uniref:YesL family protein n=1 Tax=Gracilibacillus sp. D59 TaxID=3457434 RepID=UPI003FCC8F1B